MPAIFRFAAGEGPRPSPELVRVLRLAKSIVIGKRIPSVLRPNPSGSFDLLDLIAGYPRKKKLLWRKPVS
jgi:hypothetical protein